MSRGRKAALIAACIVAAFLVAVLVIAPRLFQVDRYRPYVISVIEQRTGRRVAMGHLALTVFPSVNIRVDDLAIENPPGFPSGNWLTVKRVSARLDLGALWHHRIVIRSLGLSQPDLTLLSNPQGHWNYQTSLSTRSESAPGLTSVPGNVPGGGARLLAASRNAPRAVAASRAPSRTSVNDPPLFSLQEISAVSLKNGRLTVASLRSGGDAEPPAIEMVAQGVSGHFTDINFATADASTSAPALPASATGNLNIESLHAANIVAANVTSRVLMSPTQVSLNDVKFDFYGGKGEGNVLLNLSGAAQKYTAQGSLSGVNAAQLLAESPGMRGQMTGTLASHFTVSGVSTHSADPWAGMQGEGTLTVRQGRLPKLRIDKTLLQLAHVAEIKAASGDPSAFSLISVDWRLDHDLLTTRSVRMAGNGITVDGSGTIELPAPGRLNYQGVAHIAAVANPLTNILANISGAAFNNGKLTLPFIVGGTLQKPVFRLKENLNHILTSPPGNPNQPPQAIQNILKLFQHKKK